MAWTDACKIEACAQIDKKKETGIGVREALRLLAKESGIPYDTLDRWYYPRKHRDVKNDVTKPSEMIEKAVGALFEAVIETPKENLKQIAAKFKITQRRVNLGWCHHYEVASIKQITKDKKGKLKLSKQPDMAENQ